MSNCDCVFPNRRKAILVAAALISTMLLTAAGISYHKYGSHHFKKLISTSIEEIVWSPHRKLLPSNEVEDPTRIGGDVKACSESDIVVNQGPSDPLPSGIPTYTVEIINACATGCDITGIHLRCGWFSSARLIDPSIFKRVGHNDCLVNEGKSLPSGQTISFQYANSFSYPLSVSSVNCS